MCIAAGFSSLVAAGDTEVKLDFGAKQRDEVRILTSMAQRARSAGGLSADNDQLPNLRYVVVDRA